MLTLGAYGLIFVRLADLLLVLGATPFVSAGLALQALPIAQLSLIVLVLFLQQYVIFRESVVGHLQALVLLLGVDSFSARK